MDTSTCTVTVMVTDTDTSMNLEKRIIITPTDLTTATAMDAAATTKRATPECHSLMPLHKIFCHFSHYKSYK